MDGYRKAVYRNEGINMANVIKSDEPRNSKTCANCKHARLICMKDGTPDIKYLDVIYCNIDNTIEDANNTGLCWEEDK